MAFTPDEALARLTSALEQNRLAHAYLITGPSGSGKRELARGLCTLITAQSSSADLFGNTAPADPSGDPFEHQDVHIAQPESKSRRILIEQIRELEREPAKA